MDDELPVIALDPQLEQLLLQTLQGGSDAGIEPGLADQLLQSLSDLAQRQEMSGQPAVLLTAPQLRQWIARMARNSASNLHVLSYSEVPDSKRVSVVATVGEPRPNAA